jgi:hypothetical protein
VQAANWGLFCASCINIPGGHCIDDRLEELVAEMHLINATYCFEAEIAVVEKVIVWWTKQCPASRGLRAPLFNDSQRDNMAETHALTTEMKDLLVGYHGEYINVYGPTTSKQWMASTLVITLKGMEA